MTIANTLKDTGFNLRQAVHTALQSVRANNAKLTPDTPIRLNNVRIYKDGTFKGETNDKQDIKSIINATREVVNEIGFIPFSKIDHNNYEQYKNNPWVNQYPYALGDIDTNSLRESGGFLISDFYIPYGVAQKVENGQLRGVSVEIIPDLVDQETGKKYPQFLKAVALLGKDLEALYAVLNKYNDDETKVIKLQYEKILCYSMGDNDMSGLDKLMTAVDAICQKMGIVIPDDDKEPDPNDPNEANEDEGDDKDEQDNSANPEDENQPDNPVDNQDPEDNDDMVNDDINDMDYLKQPSAMQPQAPQGNNAMNVFVSALKALLGIQAQPTMPITPPAPIPPKPVNPNPQSQPHSPMLQKPNNNQMYSAKPNINSEEKTEMSTTPSPDNQAKKFDADSIRKSIEDELKKEYSAKIEKLETENNKLASSVGSLLDDKKLLTTKEFVYSLKQNNDGILLIPAMEQPVITALSKLSTVKEKHFSAGAEVEESPQEIVKNLVSELVTAYQPYMKAFGMKEVGKVRKEGSDSNPASDVKNVDPASELSFSRIQEYSAKHNLPFNTADKNVNAANYRACMSAVEEMEASIN